MKPTPFCVRVVTEVLSTWWFLSLSSCCRFHITSVLTMIL